VKARHRSRDRDVKEGDRNTTYFHTVANQRRRKMTVHSLDGPDGAVTDPTKMLQVPLNSIRICLKKNLALGFL
jgi:hypothetical protein